MVWSHVSLECFLCCEVKIWLYSSRIDLWIKTLLKLRRKSRDSEVPKHLLIRRMYFPSHSYLKWKIPRWLGGGGGADLPSPGSLPERLTFPGYPHSHMALSGVANLSWSQRGRVGGQQTLTLMKMPAAWGRGPRKVLYMGNKTKQNNNLFCHCSCKETQVTVWWNFLWPLDLTAGWGVGGRESSVLQITLIIGLPWKRISALKCASKFGRKGQKLLGGGRRGDKCFQWKVFWKGLCLFSSWPPIFKSEGDIWGWRGFWVFRWARQNRSRKLQPHSGSPAARSDKVG